MRNTLVMQGLGDGPPQNILGMQGCHTAYAVEFYLAKTRLSYLFLRSNIEQKIVRKQHL